MLIKLILWMLGIIASALLLYEKYLSEPKTHRERRGWRYGLLALLIFCAVAILSMPFFEKEPLDHAETVLAVQEGTDTLNIKVNKVLEHLEDNQQDNEDFCCEYATLVEERLRSITNTSLDSAYSHWKIEQYDEALLMTNIARLAAVTESQVIEVLYFRASTFMIIGLDSTGRQFNLQSDKALEAAIVNYDSILSYQPSDSEAVYFRGCSEQGMGRYREAITSFLISVRHSFSTDVRYSQFRRIAKCYELSGVHDSAVVYLDSAINVAPDYPGGYGEKGRLLLELRRPKEAIVYIEHCLTLDATDCNSLVNLSWALYQCHIEVVKTTPSDVQSNYLARALACTRTGLNLSCSKEHLWTVRALLLGTSGYFKESAEACDSAYLYGWKDSTLLDFKRIVAQRSTE